METTFIDKATAKAVGAILKSAQTHPKKQLGYAYLGRRGLTCSDGKRALRIHVEALDEKYGDFVRETGRVVVFFILKEVKNCFLRFFLTGYSGFFILIKGKLLFFGLRFLIVKILRLRLTALFHIVKGHLFARHGRTAGKGKSFIPFLL